MIESWAIKKILQAFENKDVGCIRSVVVQECINPSALIPSKGVSLLHLIIGHQSESFAFRITKLFLRCGGDPNVQSSDGVTPIHVAAGWGRNRILHLLLVNGGDPWMQDDEKKNAFNYAFEEREWNTIEMLHRFQQMHSAARWRQEMEPKYDRSLERILLRKGEDMFAYAPTKKCMKSMTTQTQSECSRSSPVQEKIKYFEPVSSEGAVEVGGDAGWGKDFYQTSCEVVVHEEEDPKEKEKGEKEEKEKDEDEEEEEEEETKTKTNKRFVSSVQIETTPPRRRMQSMAKADQLKADVRGQLFEELQEAVRRRSRLKMVQKPGEVVTIRDDSAIEAEDESNSKDSFAGKEVSYLYGINMEESGMLKNMSDFATKVMKEMEVTEKTVDLCVSSPDLTGTYLSCEDAAVAARQENSHSNTSITPQNLYLTPFTSDIIQGGPGEENSNESFLSLTEEYKYTDSEEGVVLLEKKLVVTPNISFYQHERVGGESSGEVDASMASSNASAVPSSLSYNSDVLRSELIGLGYNPGPVTETTKKLYLRKLWKLRKDANRTTTTTTPQLPLKEKNTFVHSPLLQTTLADVERFREIFTYAHLEEEMCHSFDKWTKRKWRGGSHKTSFNYLLLDPRISLNLPTRSSAMPPHHTWKHFLSAIFYVGKGKKSRPYAHLYQAAAVWEKRTELPPDGKTRRIIDIWKGGSGVVCLQVFQNIIPVEALTREAAMIEAMGLSSLENVKPGEYYGVAATWPAKDKVRLGAHLLHKAMLIFINEGERQIRPYDMD